MNGKGVHFVYIPDTFFSISRMQLLFANGSESAFIHMYIFPLPHLYWSRGISVASLVLECLLHIREGYCTSGKATAHQGRLLHIKDGNLNCRYGNHNSKTPQNPSGNWLQASACGKRCGIQTSKTPQNPAGNWLKAPLCGKRSGNQNPKAPQNPPGNWLKAPL